MQSRIYFVGIDFSPGSYKAVQYAILLAKKMEAMVQLHHVIDADEIAESNNHFVVARSIDHLKERAESQMRSFAEMILETHNVPVYHSISIGNPAASIISEINKKKPEAVFLGRSNGNCFLLKKVLSRVTVPVFIVPKSTEVQLLSNIIFATDLKPVTTERLGLLIDLVKQDHQTVSVLHIQTNPHVNGTNHELTDSKLSEQLKFNSHLVLKHNEPVEGILAHVKSNGTNLLVTVKRERNFFGRMLSKSISKQLAMHADIPILVISEIHQ